MLTELELSFLRACQEVVIRQQELLPALGEALGIQPEKIYYAWVSPHKFNSSGMIDNTDWGYWFHGLECDLKNLVDGRFLRIDFGPRGKLNTFTGWGVLQFVMTSKPPWSEFRELEAHLAEKPPPFNELSGSHEKMMVLFERLMDLGLVEVSDAELCALEKAHTITNPNGSKSVSFPQDLPQHVVWDTFVCHRSVISDLGQQTIESQI